MNTDCFWTGFIEFCDRLGLFGWGPLAIGMCIGMFALAGAVKWAKGKS